MANTLKLNAHQTLVYEALLDMREPVGAYVLLERLREHGLRGPQQVYRALEKLVGLKLVHRLDSLNAFVACQQAHDEPHEPAVFMICNDCGRVDEVVGGVLTQTLQSMATGERFTMDRHHVELRGACEECRVA